MQPTIQLMFFVAFAITLACCANLPAGNQAICYLEMDDGPCRALHPRYFYNKETGKCEPFSYGGCEGNDNNFDTEDDCKKACPGHQ